MDKDSTQFALTSFGLMLGIVPNMASLKKIVNNVGTSIPASLKDDLGIDKFPETIKKFAESGSANVVDDARDYFKKWLENAEKVVNDTPEDSFERRGRDVSNVRVTLFGTELSVPEHGVELLKGSKLFEIMQKGPGKGFGSWSDLNMVLNSVKNAVSQVIPEEHKPKRNKKGTATETEGVSETTE